MSPLLLSDKALAYLRKLCVEIPTRCVGSEGNREATDSFARTAASFGFTVESPAFDCIDWSQDGADLTVDGVAFDAKVGPYSLGGRVTAPLVAATTLQELEAVDAAGKVLLVSGELAVEQLMPKNFTFFNPDEHKRVVALLEAKRPAAIVAATTRNAEMTGAVYPFPLIEDGDFDIPSVYMTEEEGARLARRLGERVQLDIRATRTPATGCNVIARKGASADRRVVLFAHVDAKDGTPGAIDNAGGVVVLLLLAELLADYAGELGIELVAMNGEDYYSSPGEIQWVENNAGRFEEIVLGINLDGVGHAEGKTAFSLYGCSDDVAGLVRRAFDAQEGMIEGEPWYQSDHSLFLMNQRPALAVTSEHFMALLAEIVHTPKDAIRIVDPSKLVATARALKELLIGLARHFA